MRQSRGALAELVAERVRSMARVWQYIPCGSEVIAENFFLPEGNFGGKACVFRHPRAERLKSIQQILWHVSPMSVNTGGLTLGAIIAESTFSLSNLHWQSSVWEMYPIGCIRIPNPILCIKRRYNEAYG